MRVDRRSYFFRWLWTGFISVVGVGALTCWFHRVPPVEPAAPAPAESVKITAHPLLPQASVGKDYAFQFTTAPGEAVEWKLFSPVPGVGTDKDWKEWKLEPGGRLTGKAAGGDCDPAKGGCPEGWICGAGKRCEGIVTFNVIATDRKGKFEQRSFDLVVTDSANPLEVGNFATLTAAAVGRSYEVQLYARGGSAPFTWKESKRSLPPGLVLDPTGILSGAPTGPGTFELTVEVTDSASRKATKKLSLRVDDISKPAEFTPNPDVVVRAVTPRIGLNVSDETTHFNDSKLSNQYIENPGFAPTPPVRRMYWAWAGTANTLEEWNYAQFLELEELNTGFWDGGHYWILSGPAKGREGKIAKYERVPDKSVESGYRAVWTLSDSDPSRVVQKRPDPKDMEKDIFMVEALPRNLTYPDQFRGSISPTWWALGVGATYSAEKIGPASDKQIAKFSTGSDGKVGLGCQIIWNNTWRRLRKDTTYRFSVDVRQSGVEERKVLVEMGPPFWTQWPFFSQSFDVPDDGRFHRLTGEFTGNGENMAGFQVLLYRPGTLWLTNALLWESSSSLTPANGAAQKAVPAKVYEPLPFILDDLRKLGAGCLRFWYHDSFLPLRTALTASSESAPGPVHNIFSNLKLAEVLGSNAWIIAAKEWTPAEFAQIAEYLSSRDTTSGLGKLRAEQGHPVPWTDTIRRIYIEYVDEAWNWPAWAYPFDPWHPNKYASFAKERFSAFRASKHYSPKVTLVLSGQLGDDFWVNDPVDKLAYPSHDAMDAAPYTGTYPASPISELSAVVADEIFAHTERVLGTMKVWASRRERTKMLAYEGGPATGSHTPSAADEIRKNSMILASLTLDSIADLFANGVEEYNLFTYQNNAAWQVITGASSRFRLPIWYATSMFNRACGGGKQVETKGVTAAPTMITIDHEDAKKTKRGAVPAISVRSYLKNDRKSFLLINRNPQVEYPVVLHTGDINVSYRVTTLAGSRPDRGTLEGPGLVPSDPSERDLSKIFEAVQPRTEDVKSTQAGVRVALPPASIVTVQAAAGLDS